MQVGPVLLQKFADSLGTAYLLQDTRILEAALVAEIQGHEGYYQVRGHESGLVVHEHHPVSVSVVDDAHIGSATAYKLLERLHVLGHERIRLVVREAAVYGVEDVFRAVAIDLFGKEVGHPVGQVKGELEIAVVTLELLHEVDIVIMDVHFVHGAALCRHRGRP